MEKVVTPPQSLNGIVEQANTMIKYALVVCIMPLVHPVEHHIVAGATLQAGVIMVVQKQILGTVIIELFTVMEVVKIVNILLTIFIFI